MVEGPNEKGRAVGHESQGRQAAEYPDQLDFSSALTGEAREAGREGTESSGAMNGTENPASTNRLMEEVCELRKPEGSIAAGEGQQR
jgi:hypothetical protein